MKDYWDYHRPSKDKIMYDGAKNFDKALASISGTNIEINGVPARAIIGDKFASLQIDQKTISVKHELLNIGDIVTHNSSPWLVMNFPNDNGINQDAIIQMCSATINWTKDGVDNASPCTIVSTTRFSTNNVVRYDFATLNGDIFICTQFNTVTKTLKIGERFIVNRNAYKITGINDSSTVVHGRGYINITAKIDTIDPINDDVDNGKAHNNDEQLPNNAPSPIDSWLA